MKTLTLCSFTLIAVLALHIKLIHAQTINGEIVLDTNNLHVIKVWGTASERAYAYGYLLAPQCSDMFTGYIKPLLAGSHYNEMRNIILSGEDIAFDSVFILEAMALIEGVKASTGNPDSLDYIDVLIGNSIEDLRAIVFSDKSFNCSSLMSWGDATTGTDLAGKAVVSHHMDLAFINFSLINNQVIVVNFPSETGMQDWLLVHLAGSLVPINGVNMHFGVFGQSMSDYNETVFHGKGYLPYGYGLRKSLEAEDYNNDMNHDVLDVKAALNDCSEGFANGEIIAVLAATQPNDSLTAMVCEVASNLPTHVYRHNNYPDSIPGDNLYTANSQIARNNAMHFCNRYNGIIDHIGDGTMIGQEENWNLAKDYSGLYTNIQFMQYAPEADLLRVAFRSSLTVPAYNNIPIVFSLNELFTPPMGVGIKHDSDKTTELKIFPNPASTGIDIETPMRGFLYISNLNGHQLLQKEVTEPAITIDVSGLRSGVYLVKVVGEKVVKMGKFVKK